MKYGKKSYFVLLGLYTLFLASLTTYILTGLNPVDHPQFYNCSEFFTNANNSTVHLGLPEEPYKDVNQISRILCCILCGVYLIVSLLEDSWLILFKVRKKRKESLMNQKDI